MNNRLMNYLKKGLAMMFFLLAASAVFAQEADVNVAEATPHAVWSSPLFWVLIIAIISLLLVIITIGYLLSMLVETKLKEGGSSAAKKSILPVLVIFSFLSLHANAEGAAAVSQPLFGAVDPKILMLLLGTVVLELLIILYLFYIMQRIMLSLGYRKAKDRSQSSWKMLMKKMTRSVPLEEETTIETEHEYDGIRELDNNLPPWWVYMFYLTIVFAGAYIFYYHFGSGSLQEKEYENELAYAKVQKDEYLKTAAQSIDENNVVWVTDQPVLDEGRKLFIEKCAACHGQKGEGGVGPNFADEYWLHGGSINDIFKTIKYGVQEKGMIAWQGQLQPKEMQSIASFIKSLKGSNPPNAKAPQGELYIEEAVKADTTIVAADSLK